MKNPKRGGWKGRKVSGGRANVPDTRVKPERPRLVWVREEGAEYFESMKLCQPRTVGEVLTLSNQCISHHHRKEDAPMRFEDDENQDENTDK